MGRGMPVRGGIGGRLVAGAALAAVLIVSPAMAQENAPAAKADSPKAASPKAEAAPLKIELNRLEPAGEACRTYMLVDNSRGPALKSLKVDLFAFDTEGVAQKRLAVELGPVQEKKTVVRLFDFAGLACPKIGRLLLNDVLTCEGGDATRETCLERIEPATKTSAAFDR
ncbi:Tat pathway signal protein [Methylorubrum zatmanii]|uniref:Tat pathway signal protein n=1 Tax=Methylorubrum zatmanii TaxID=29429 RepID=A0ABW1WSU9_9HYPH|nr:Tat pathway signal protein [Methylorubrum zatmanii]MBD8908759.1 Tat pathway signal protein [Methylorubrum zatmanii]